MGTQATACYVHNNSYVIPDIFFLVIEEVQRKNLVETTLKVYIPLKLIFFLTKIAKLTEKFFFRNYSKKKVAAVDSQFLHKCHHRCESITGSSFISSPPSPLSVYFYVVVEDIGPKSTFFALKVKAVPWEFFSRAPSIP